MNLTFRKLVRLPYWMKYDAQTLAAQDLSNEELSSREHQDVLAATLGQVMLEQLPDSERAECIKSVLEDMQPDQVQQILEESKVAIRWLQIVSSVGHEVLALHDPTNTKVD